MTVKQWLRRARSCDKEISGLKLAKEAEYARLLSITTSLDGSVVSGTKDPHKFDGYAELISMFDAKKKELYEIKREVTEAIMQVEDSRFRELLLLYYVSCLTWEQIAVNMGYAYRQVTRLHGRALEAVAPIVEKMSLNVPQHTE